MSINHTPFARHFIVEPGNMTRYELLYIVYTDTNYGTQRCGFTWLNSGGSGETFTWPKGSTIFSSYACGNSKVHRTDLIAILCAIKARYPESIERLVGFEEYDENGLYRGKVC